MKKVLVSLVFVVLLSSCYTSRTYVGNVKPGDKVEVAQVKKNHFLVAGLVCLSKDTEVSNGNCVVLNQFTFIDLILSGVTGGLYTPNTTKILTPVR